MAENSAMTIVEFLEARIADDEAVAHSAAARSPEWPRKGTWWLEGVKHEVVGEEEAFCHPHNADHIARHDPARVLAECTAKRAIAGLHKEGADICDEHNAMFESIPCQTIRALAAVYADHPDYQQEWNG